MAVSLEVRVPLLDHKVVEFVSRIPSKIRVKGGELKHVFRRAMKGIVPDEILARKKKGFSIPQTRWLEDGMLKDGRDGMRGPARMALWLLDQWMPGWKEGMRA
jgi:asparagine synthase (glutamine-hydrolysing)